MDEFVELRRNFYSVSTDDAVWVDYEDKPNWAMSEATHWDELEHNYRTIILAEAGSGKTIEIQQAAKRIKSAGKYAFFIRLEYLSEGMEYAFDDGQTGTLKEFEEWLASDEEAWLFLDSVDEARLRDPRDFEKAKLVALTMALHLFEKSGRPAAFKLPLREAVKGNAELETLMMERLRRRRPSDDEREFARQRKKMDRRRREREKKDAEVLTRNQQWLSENHSQMLDKRGAANGSVWNCQVNLYREMRKTAPDRNRWSFKNWRDLETRFGVEVARSFRDSLVAFWREYQPVLRSEGVKEPSSVSHAVVLGLCGITIESAESPTWPSDLSEAEAERAVRYALWELNGFPVWLKSLSTVFPSVVHDCLAKEVQWEINVSEEQETVHYVLSDLVWHGQDIDVGLSRTLMGMLRHRLPRKIQNLSDALIVIVRDETISDCELAQFAKAAVSATAKMEEKAYLTALLISVSPDDGFHVLQEILLEMQELEARTTFCMVLAVQLLGGRRSGGSYRSRFKTACHLKQLYFVLHENIRRSDDIERAGMGVYSPGLRDDAQDARNSVFRMLSEIPGKETYLALKEIAENYPEVENRAWMMSHAHARAIQDGDLIAWKPSDVRDFSRDAEFLPSSHRQLFELSRSRLLDLKDDLENGDTSPAEILAKADEEVQLRNFVGGWLRDRAKGRYMVPQEDELADAKRPDLRFLTTGFDGPVPIEIKIADRWSGTQLFERIENQLCNDYLRDKRSSCGVFLLFANGKQSFWKHPETGASLNFSELCVSLQEHSLSLISARPDIEAISVIGIDLKFRSIAVRKSARS